MADQRIKGMKFATFPEANYDERHVAAVLITKDDAGNLHAYVKESPGFHGPDPEIVALLVQSVELANL